MDFPFLYSFALSVLQKLDQCNLNEFGNRDDMKKDVEMLKGILNHLPSILETHGLLIRKSKTHVDDADADDVATADVDDDDLADDDDADSDDDADNIAGAGAGAGDADDDAGAGDADDDAGAANDSDDDAGAGAAATDADDAGTANDDAGDDDADDDDDQHHHHHDDFGSSIIFDIQKSVFGLHDLLNEKLHPSFKSSWKDLVAPLTKFQDHKHPESSKEEENLLSSLSVALPKVDYQDVKVNNLPLHLVPCLAYCALYPEGYRVVRETLVNHWMAEGFPELQTPSSSSISGDLELEEIGNSYFMELLSMGVFVKPLFGFGGNSANQPAVTVYSCEIHPRMHKLACQMAHNEVFVFHYHRYGHVNEWTGRCTMYIALHQNLQEYEWTGKYDQLQTGIRTCLFFVPKIQEDVLERIISDLSELQILDLAEIQFKKPPASLSKTGKLRYLAFSRNTLLKRLDNINWSSLQTLAVDGCVQLEKVNLEHTSHMRHLYYTSKEATLDVHTSTLRILQLSYCWLRSFSLSNSANFTCLRRLRIFECPRLVSLPDSIDLLSQVQQLVFHNCTRLDLNYGRSMDSLPSLQYMELIGLPKLTELPAGLQSAGALQYLMIADCKRLRSTDHALQHLVNLQRLCVYDCATFSIAPIVFQSLTALQSLDIRNCPSITIRSTSDPGKHHAPFISHIPEIILDGQLLLDPRFKYDDDDDVEDDNVIVKHDDDYGFFSPFITPVQTSEESIMMEDGDVLQEMSKLGLPLSFRSGKQSAVFSKKEAAALGPQKPSFGAQSDSFTPGICPHFILSLETFEKINSSQGMVDQKYKLKVPSKWKVLAQALKAIVNCRILQQQKLYCCLFPGDYEFERDLLFQLWLVRGFLPEHCKHLFKQLLVEEYIRESRTDILTGISKYTVNVGKVTALSNSFKSEDHYTLIQNDEEPKVDGSTSWHHVSVASKSVRKVFQRIEGFSELRSVLFLRDYGSALKQIPSTFFTTHQNMQALDLSGSHISELPSSIGKMTDLRFLDLSFTLIERIPESIHLLTELLTLKLRGCKHLHTLPKGMKELVNLYHLDFDMLGQLTSMPKGLGSLTKLRTLSAFIVSKEDGCSLGELKHMNNLCGSLCISGLEYANFRDAAMPHKSHLTGLNLKWSHSKSYNKQDREQAFHSLFRLEAPPSLTELQISNYPGQKFPAWIEGLENLVSFTLLNCHIDYVAYLEWLPKLKHLNIYGLNKATYFQLWISKERVNFPELETLTIDIMHSLKRWSGWEKATDFPKLSKLSIKNCPKLRETPFLMHLPSLTYLEISDCKCFQSLPKGELSVETLIIENCPSLRKGCLEGGADWEKIKHVKNIWIDMKRICSSQEDKDSLSETDSLSEDKSESSDDESQSPNDKSD